MPLITIKITNHRLTTEETFGSNDASPRSVKALLATIQLGIAKFYAHEVGLPRDISIDVKDFADEHTSVGYTP